MTIEIHSPHLKIREDILDSIEKKVLSLSHLNKKIAKAEIFLTEEDSFKVCGIRLNIFGDTLFVSKTGNSFGDTVTSAVKALKILLTKKKERKNEPPDEIISTVKV